MWGAAASSRYFTREFGTNAPYELVLTVNPLVSQESYTHIFICTYDFLACKVTSLLAIGKLLFSVFNIFLDDFSLPTPNYDRSNLVQDIARPGSLSCSKNKPIVPSTVDNPRVILIHRYLFLCCGFEFLSDWNNNFSGFDVHSFL